MSTRSRKNKVVYVARQAVGTVGMDADTAFDEATLQIRVDSAVGITGSVSGSTSTSASLMPATPLAWAGVFQIWVGGFDFANRVFASVRADKEDPTCHDNGISLVELDTPSSEYGVEGRRLVFLKWNYTGATYGQIFHTDAADLLLWPTPKWHPTQVYSKVVVIVYKCGFNFPRRLAERSRIPEWVLRAQAMWETSSHIVGSAASSSSAAAASSTLVTATVTTDPCFICGLLEDGGGDAAAAIVHCCSTCRLSSHTHCSTGLADFAERDSAVAPVYSACRLIEGDDELRHRFLPTSCCLCRAVWRR